MIDILIESVGLFLDNHESFSHICLKDVPVKFMPSISDLATESFTDSEGNEYIECSPYIIAIIQFPDCEPQD